MTDKDKTIAYYRTAATQARTHERPKHIPCRVRISRTVRGDGPWCGTQIGPGEYECNCNPLGAVSVTATNGILLWLRLDEFEPIAWAVNEKA